MRLVTCVHEGRTLVGSFIDRDAKIVDLLEAARLRNGGDVSPFVSMLALIEAGDAAWDAARRLTENPPEKSVLDSRTCRLLAPLPAPTQIRDFLCFEGHLIGAFKGAARLAAQMSDASEAEKLAIEQRQEFAIPDIWYSQPIYYVAGRTEIASPDDVIHRPHYCEYFDYELEFAAVISRRGKNIGRDVASAHIFGYTIYNDWSARDEQVRSMRGMLGPGKGKDFDQGITLGPCIVTADEIGDPYALEMSAHVNGERWSHGYTGDMHYKFEDCIASVSRSQTLFPGEIIGSGTVPGGCGLEHFRFLQNGDEVALTVSGIGTLRNWVEA